MSQASVDVSKHKVLPVPKIKNRNVAKLTTKIIIFDFHETWEIIKHSTCGRFQHSILLIVQRINHFLHVLFLQFVRFEREINFNSINIHQHIVVILYCADIEWNCWLMCSVYRQLSACAFINKLLLNSLGFSAKSSYNFRISSTNFFASFWQSDKPLTGFSFIEVSKAATTSTKIIFIVLWSK